MVLDQIRNHLTESMKQKNEVRRETLRYLLSAIIHFAKAKYGAAGESSLSDEDVIDVVRKQVKSHKESIAAFTKGNRPELVDKEQAQLAILETYLPIAVADDELQAILNPIVQTGEKNFGLLMKQAMEQLKGKADGGRVAGILKNLMQS